MPTSSPPSPRPCLFPAIFSWAPTFFAMTRISVIFVSEVRGSAWRFCLWPFRGFWGPVLSNHSTFCWLVVTSAIYKAYTQTKHLRSVCTSTSSLILATDNASLPRISTECTATAENHLEDPTPTRFTAPKIWYFFLLDKELLTRESTPDELLVMLCACRSTNG